MTVGPDREERPGGRWSTIDLVDDLIRMAAVERAVAHVVAGWVVKVPELDEKLRLADALEPSMERANAMRRHALALLERNEPCLTGNTDWVRPLRELDATSESEQVVQGILGDVSVFLLARYRDIGARIDPLYDARLLHSVRSAIDSLSRQNASGGVLDHRKSSFKDSLETAWCKEKSRPVPLDDLLWNPHDRVPIPARPVSRPRPQTGAMGHLRSGSRRDPANIAGELNANVIAELCALELMSRCSYEHPDLDWSFHIAVARHASDESRHAAIFRRLLAERRFAEDDLPQHATNYEFAYEFPECEPASKRELVWRLLLLCTVLEGLAIDKIPPEIATLDWLGQSDIARALDYIAADELFHAENGLRLTRALCDAYHFDPMLERERVHGRFFARQLQVRTRYLEEDPERAAREIEIMEGPDPDQISFVSRTEIELRRRASFTSYECDQVDRWGYNNTAGRSQ